MVSWGVGPAVVCAFVVGGSDGAVVISKAAVVSINVVDDIAGVSVEVLAVVPGVDGAAVGG